MISRHGIARIAIVTCLAGAAHGQSTLDWPRGELVPYERDSTTLANATLREAAPFREIVRVEGAASMRLFFADAVLAPGSTVRMTSLHDGEVQQLDAAGLAMWGRSSAYFNGDAVRVELVLAPATAASRLVLDHVVVERGQAAEDGICGECNGDRVSSNEDYAGRLLPAGCSATVWNLDSCVVSAGHCVAGNDVIQFRVPPSNPDCSLNHPPADDQFPMVETLFENNGPGNDWSTLRAGTNGLGQLPYDRFGAFLPIAPEPAPVGVTARVWGYGVSFDCVLSQSQQTSDGEISTVLANRYLHDIDTTGGNSGSCVVFDGRIIGIATHCTCPANTAQRVDTSEFIAARNAMCPCPGDIDGSGVVGFGDVLKVLANWGASGVPADTNNDGTVDFADLLVVLSEWGPC